jgi:hypothetical protein
MTLLTREELKILVESDSKPRVSIFIPTHRAGEEIHQDPIRLKNLISRAEERLMAAELRRPAAKELLAPLRDLVEDEEFWQHQADGLALFVSPETYRDYSLPLEFEELVVVADDFHLKPLLPLLSGNGRFYILAVSQNDIRLLEGTRHQVRGIELQDVPKSLAEALRYDDPERSVQFHTEIRTIRDGRRAMFHGHGVVTDEDKNNILRYFHKVDQGLHDMLGNERAPLLLAGVAYLLPIYREANTYPHLLDAKITGNPEELRPEELHAQGWKVVQPYFEEAQHKAVTLYEELAANSERPSRDVQEIVSAAHYARIDTLFVAVGLHRWGTFNADSDTIEVHDEAQPGDEDLLDVAAVHTLLNDGTIYAVQPEAVPDGAPAAAVFRF